MKLLIIATTTILFTFSVQGQSEHKTLSWLKKNLVKEAFYEVSSCEEGGKYMGALTGFEFNPTADDLTVKFAKGQVTQFKWADITSVVRQNGKRESIVVHLYKELCTKNSGYKYRHLELFLNNSQFAADFKKYFLRIAKLRGAVIEE